MSNHLHIVVHMSPMTANTWSPEEVATRWVRLYPARNAELCARLIKAIKAIPPLQLIVGKAKHIDATGRRGGVRAKVNEFAMLTWL